MMLYAVFTNEQLAQAAASRPRSKADLLKIGGIGESRAEKYGPRLLSSKLRNVSAELARWSE